MVTAFIVPLYLHSLARTFIQQVYIVFWALHTVLEAVTGQAPSFWRSQWVEKQEGSFQSVSEEDWNVHLFVSCFLTAVVLPPRTMPATQ